MSDERLNRIEPDYSSEFVSRPFSLTSEELDQLPVTVMTSPIFVLARVGYPAIANRMRCLALAWTQRVVYVQREDRGVHLAGALA